MTDTTYTRIPATEATAGDEFYLADQWHRAKAVYVTGDRVTVIWPEGGRVSGPAHHLMARRAVPVTEGTR